MYETILLIALIVVIAITILSAVSLGFWMGRQSVNMPVSMMPQFLQGATRYEPEEDVYEKAMRPEEEGRIPTVEEDR